MIDSYSSLLLDNAVEQLSKLPGIGRKTALRLALHLLRREPEQANQLGNSIIDLRNNVSYCSRCHNISDSQICPICSDMKRNQSIVCVVENIKDVLTIEATHKFNGLYHVLGGLISPIDGIAPGDIEIESLVNRVENENIKEIILALSPTMEGDTTGFYIFRRLNTTDTQITVLARGITIGNELEYTDELTLGRSITNRIPFSDSFSAT
jgi:recombination protein RecR